MTVVTVCFERERSGNSENKYVMQSQIGLADTDARAQFSFFFTVFVAVVSAADTGGGGRPSFTKPREFALEYDKW